MNKILVVAGEATVLTLWLGVCGLIGATTYSLYQVGSPLAPFTSGCYAPAVMRVIAAATRLARV